MKDLNDALYGYVPTRSVCFIFLVLFAVSTIIHTWQAARSRAWWLFPTVVLAGLGEVTGWVARALASWSPLDTTIFKIQITTLILAPTPFVAALFIGFGRVSARLGAQYSRLSPKMYSRIFLTGDIVSLLVQGGGGGIAASATDDPKQTRLGSNIILAGLIVQIVSMTIFCCLAAEYAWRRYRNRPFHKTGHEDALQQVLMDRHMKMLIMSICISTALIYVRSVYRIIEYIDGFDGTIAHTQVLFNVFDGMLVTLAIYTLNFMHPGHLLKATAQPQLEGYALNGKMSTTA